jgi:predicted amidophosphoribosyltransferase
VGLLLPYLITYLESPLPHPPKKKRKKEKKKKRKRKERRELKGNFQLKKHVSLINLL